MSTQEQQWLQKAIDLSVPYQRELWIESENESLQAVIDAGVEVSYPEKEFFQEATLPMVESFREDPEIAELIDRIRNEKN